MRNIVLILVLLLGSFFILAIFNVPEPLRGRIAIACVFLFTGLGHFAKAKPMSAMVPVRIPEPWRLPIIYFSGVFEFAAALAILADAWARMAGIILCAFLVLVLPAHIDSTMRRVPFGGHSAGPVYLFVRIPLQLLLIGWIWWFTVLRKS